MRGRSIDVPLGIRMSLVYVLPIDRWAWTWLAFETDQPIASGGTVTYLYNRLTDGPTIYSPGRSTAGLLTRLCGSFVESIDQWSTIYLPGRSTDGVLYTSFSNLVWWAWGLAVAEWPMGHTVQSPIEEDGEIWKNGMVEKKKKKWWLLMSMK